MRRGRCLNPGSSPAPHLSVPAVIQQDVWALDLHRARMGSGDAAVERCRIAPRTPPAPLLDPVCAAAAAAAGRLPAGHGGAAAGASPAEQAHIAVDDGRVGQVQVQQAAGRAERDAQAPPPRHLRRQRLGARRRPEHIVQAAPAGVLCQWAGAEWAGTQVAGEQGWRPAQRRGECRGCRQRQRGMLHCAALPCPALHTTPAGPAGTEAAPERHPPVMMQGGRVHRPRKETRLGCRMRHITPASCAAAVVAAAAATAPRFAGRRYRGLAPGRAQARPPAPVPSLLPRSPALHAALTPIRRNAFSSRPGARAPGSSPGASAAPAHLLQLAHHGLGQLQVVRLVAGAADQHLDGHRRLAPQAQEHLASEGGRAACEARSRGAATPPAAAARPREPALPSERPPQPQLRSSRPPALTLPKLPRPMGRSTRISSHSTAHCCTAGGSCRRPLDSELAVGEAGEAGEAGRAPPPRSGMEARRVEMKEMRGSLSGSSGLRGSQWGKMGQRDSAAASTERCKWQCARRHALLRCTPAAPSPPSGLAAAMHTSSPPPPRRRRPPSRCSCGAGCRRSW